MRIWTGLALALGLTAAGCDVQALFNGEGDGGLFEGAVLEEGPEAVPIGEPGADRRQWRAAVDATQRVTGNLTASLPDGRAGELVLAFGNGLTYRLQQLGIQEGRDRVGAAADSFADLLGAVAEAGVYVYRVNEERVDNVAPEGGLCGRGGRTTFLAISEYLTAEGEWSFNVGAFRSVDPPGPSAPGEPGFCGAYVFELR